MMAVIRPEPRPKSSPCDDGMNLLLTQKASVMGTMGHGTRDHDTMYRVCLHTQPVHVSQGVTVASWRWAEVNPYFVISTFIFIAALAKLGFHHARFLSSKLPESCVLIILGVVMGVITYHLTDSSEVSHSSSSLHVNCSSIDQCSRDNEVALFPKFNSQLFFLVLLPPIVLEASYSLHHRTFANNLGTVLLYAVVGTLLNMFIIGPILYGLAVSGLMGSLIVPTTKHLDVTAISIFEILSFSALIVAVDPVAVLAIFHEVGVNKTLYYLVFGESLLNDAVTVVLYNAMVALAVQPMSLVSASQILLAVAAFFTVSLGGLLIGCIFGLITALVTKHTRQVQVVESLSLLVMAYLSYLTAELVHFSGIIATVACGVMQAHYAMRNISKNSCITIKYFISMASSTSEAIIFLFLGMVLVSGQYEFHLGFAMWTLVLCLTVRFLVVYLLTWLVNRWRVEPIGKKEQFIMAYGGLRGAVGFSLAAMLRDTSIEQEKVSVFVTTTLFIVLFTVFVQGSTIKLLVNIFHIKLNSDRQPLMVEEVTSTTALHISAGVEEIIGYHGSNRFRTFVAHIDDKYLQPLLVRSRGDIYMSRLYDQLALEEHYNNLHVSASPLRMRQLMSQCSDDINTQFDAITSDTDHTPIPTTPIPTTPATTIVQPGSPADNERARWRNVLVKRMPSLMGLRQPREADVEMASIARSPADRSSPTRRAGGSTVRSLRQTSSLATDSSVLYQALRDHPFDQTRYRRSTCPVQGEYGPGHDWLNSNLSSDRWSSSGVASQPAGESSIPPSHHHHRWAQSGYTRSVSLEQPPGGASVCVQGCRGSLPPPLPLPLPSSQSQVNYHDTTQLRHSRRRFCNVAQQLIARRQLQQADVQEQLHVIGEEQLPAGSSPADDPPTTRSTEDSAGCDTRV